MNSLINFELAKLLKKKGFEYQYQWSPAIDNLPTIAEVVMWLYEKHSIWVKVTPIPYSDNLTHWRWEHVSTNYATRSLNWKKEQDYMSPKEAYEAAIEYTLKNLI